MSEIFCIRCAATTENNEFCCCVEPNIYEWMTPEIDLAYMALPKCWNVVQFREAATDTI